MKCTFVIALTYEKSARPHPRYCRHSLIFHDTVDEGISRISRSMTGGYVLSHNGLPLSRKINPGYGFFLARLWGMRLLLQTAPLRHAKWHPPSLKRTLPETEFRSTTLPSPDFRNKISHTLFKDLSERLGCSRLPDMIDYIFLWNTYIMFPQGEFVQRRLKPHIPRRLVPPAVTRKASTASVTISLTGVFKFRAPKSLSLGNPSKAEWINIGRLPK